MQAEQSLRNGDPQAALAQLQDQVRKQPAEPKHRIFLFQLLAVLGQWERALNQLNVAGEMDSSTLSMVQTYRETIGCEALRSEVFRGKRSPLIFGEPAQWVALMIEALRPEADAARQQALRDQALEQAPATPGTINGQPFAWLADADPRLGPLLEVIVNGRYYWAPFQNIKSIQLEEPADLRDMVWAPAQFTWANGGEMVGFIPTRYPGSEASEDGLIQLARKTDWLDEGGLQTGLGQRLLATDSDDHPLLDVRAIEFDVATDVADLADDQSPEEPAG